jgi:vancomycin permeability regulator SanA
MKQFNEFKKTINGNPQEQVQQLLNSGKVSQAQYNNAVQMAQNFRKMFGM